MRTKNSCILGDKSFAFQIILECPKLGLGWMPTLYLTLLCFHASSLKIMRESGGAKGNCRTLIRNISNLGNEGLIKSYDYPLNRGSYVYKVFLVFLSNIGIKL